MLLCLVITLPDQHFSLVSFWFGQQSASQQVKVSVLVRPVLKVFSGPLGMRFQPVNCNMVQLPNKRINKTEASYTLEDTVLENVDSIISWIIFILDLGPSYTDKLLEFRWVQIAHLS